ncbi:dynein light chain 2B, cytoplasmic [Plasmodium gonderi]|uniref:Dynein light chain 2B, cytoplasmic n=1 Tax=Plasmodium gonderi TaxID=77519 RepID=A0A1Y1JKD6_PLAGO|nr:dynein light chain 2B, cytoplasmic [Plasmodium gonderi]GAW80494.1 dynein light chain 2B, cytoplasmic [Plasmodium gonderi]
MAGSSSEISESLNAWMNGNSSIASYVLINSDGIPLKYNEDVTYKQAVKQASLFSDLLTKTKRCVKELLPQENDLNSSLRIRTKKDTEYILCSYGDYSLITQQICKEMHSSKNK